MQGHVLNLNLNEQTLSVKDEQQKVYSIRLSGIKKIGSGAKTSTQLQLISKSWTY
jgi:hypothetical protein